VSSRDEPIWDKPALFYIAVALPCLGGLTLALLLTSCPSCGLAKTERVSVSLYSSGGCLPRGNNHVDDDDVIFLYHFKNHKEQSCLVPSQSVFSLSSSFSGLPLLIVVQVAIETCYQNVGVATAVALSMFRGKEQVRRGSISI
jgi:hypothetical protein